MLLCIIRLALLTTCAYTSANVPSAVVASSSSVTSELQQLATLWRSGALTDREFAVAKDRVLRGSSGGGGRGGGGGSSSSSGSGGSSAGSDSSSSSGGGGGKIFIQPSFLALEAEYLTLQNLSKNLL